MVSNIDVLQNSIYIHFLFLFLAAGLETTIEQEHFRFTKYIGSFRHLSNYLFHFHHLNPDPEHNLW